MNDQNKTNRALGIDLEEVNFSDIFNLEELQRLQDLFADAHEVASIITQPDGSPITSPSNFTRLCNEIIRKTEKGCANCFKSDASLGRHNPSGPIVQPCLSGGLLDAGASITLGGKHIANWLIGQVRSDALNEEQMLAYADEIGANRDDFTQALNEVPQMSLEKFNKIAQLLFAFANELSAKSFHEFQLQLQIAKQEKVAKQLEESKENLFTTLHSIGDGVISTDINGLIVNMNPIAEKLCGWDLTDAEGKALTEVFNIINAETCETASDPVKKTLESGEIIEHANHTLLISRNGEEFLIADSAAPIRDKRGNTTGDVLVFSDITEKAIAQRKLKESEEKYRQAFQTTSDAININQRDGVYIDVNEGFTNLTGYTLNDVIGKSSTEINIWAILEDLEKLVTGLRERGFVKNLESKFRCKDGTLKTAILSANIIVLNNEPHILTITRDITESKEMEELIHKSKQQYDNLVSNIPVGVYILHTKPEGTFALDYVSPRMAEMLGLSIESLIANANVIFEAIHPDDLEGFVRLNQEGIQQKRPFDWKGRVVIKGVVRWMHFTSYPQELESGNILWNGLIVDITEQKQAEKILWENHQRLEAIISSSPDGIGIVSLEGKIELISDKLLVIYGYTIEERDELIGRSLFDFIDSSNHKSMYDNIQGLLKGKPKDMISVYLAIKKDNTRIYVEVNSAILCDSEGNPEKILFVERDISERVKNDLIIINQNKELKELNDTKDKFFSIIAHDLRSPFNSFLGLTQIMAEELPSLTMTQVQEIAVSMSKSATNLYRLLENLLEWSQIQRGAFPFNPEVFQLGIVVGGSIDMIHESAKNKDIEIATDIAVGLEVFADRNMTQTIIRNLVSNAVKFTHKGGKISLSAKAIADKSIEISIKDTGIGMNQAMADNLFRSNVQTSRKGTEGELSTGLGLLLCKEFIEKNGGKIWVESEVERGSTFYFTLPRTISNEII